MNQKNLTIYSIIFGIIVVGSFLLGFVLQKQLSQQPSSISTENINVNLAATPESDSWWHGIGTFQKGKYWNANCNLTFIVPKGWYLQQQGFTPGNLQATTNAEQPSCNIKLGDDRQFWNVQEYSSPNPSNLSLVEWESQQMGYDVPYKEKQFREVKALFLERDPLDFLEESYMQSVIVATDGWVHTFQYLDKDASRPRAGVFAELISSIGSAKDLKLNGEKIISSKREKVNSETDLYVHGDYRFSIEMPHSWYMRDSRFSTTDVSYDGYHVSFENTVKPLYWSSGKDPSNPSAVSTEGIAVQVAQEPYANISFTKFMDARYQKGQYKIKTVVIGHGVQAVQVWSENYYQKYNQEYVFVSGDYVYTIGVRQENMKDDATINTMLKSLKLL